MDATVREHRDDLGSVINELDPDILLVVEDSNRIGDLELFFDEDIEGNRAVQVQHSYGQSQNIGVAVRTDMDKFNDPP